MWKIFEKIRNFWRKPEPEKMDVRSFISEALVQVCGGIEDAQSKINKNPISEADKKYFQPYIVPSPINSSGPNPRDNFYTIDFDLAITIEKQSSKSNEAGISVVGMGAFVGIDTFAKAKENTVEANSSISRMKFTIPVIYPSMPKLYD